MNRVFMVVTSCLAVAPISLAQVVTPPTEAPPATPAYSPPAQRAAPPVVQERPSNLQQQIANIQYDSLVNVDGGSVKLLSIPVSSAALEVNPFVAELDADDRKAIDEIDANWRIAVARVAATNVDLLTQIESGVFEQLNVEDRDSLGTMMTFIKPLNLVDKKMLLTDQLKGTGILSSRAIALNEKIATEYRNALREQYVAQASEEPDANFAAIVTRSFFYDIVMDTTDAYRFLLRDFAMSAKDIFASMNLTAEQKAAVARGTAAIAKAEDESGRTAAVRDLLAALPATTQRDALVAFIDKLEGSN